MVCAQEACWQLELDRVLLMPVGEAPHRPIELDPGREQRYELCVEAAAGAQWLSVSRVEIDRPGPSYTIETLEQLRAADADHELHFILGTDQAMQLAAWRKPQRVLQLARLAVAERDGMPAEDVQGVVAGLGGEGRMSVFAMPRVDVSSTEVRERVGAGRPYRFLVPERVADSIGRKGLYR
jgi:nicotinate-nucleotide adenylyltransferase